MAKIITGSGAELEPIIKKYHNRDGLTLIIPTDADNSDIQAPTEAEIAAANARLRRHIVKLDCVHDLDNERIDADLAAAYGDDTNAQRSD